MVVVDCMGTKPNKLPGERETIFNFTILRRFMMQLLRFHLTRTRMHFMCGINEKWSSFVVDIRSDSELKSPYPKIRSHISPADVGNSQRRRASVQSGDGRRNLQEEALVILEVSDALGFTSSSARTRLLERIYELEERDRVAAQAQGMICIGQKQFRKALELLHNVVTAPMPLISAIYFKIKSTGWLRIHGEVAGVRVYTIEYKEAAVLRRDSAVLPCKLLTQLLLIV